MWCVPSDSRTPPPERTTFGDLDLQLLSATDGCLVIRIEYVVCLYNEYMNNNEYIIMIIDNILNMPSFFT